MKKEGTKVLNHSKVLHMICKGKPLWKCVIKFTVSKSRRLENRFTLTRKSKNPIFLRKRLIVPKNPKGDPLKLQTFLFQAEMFSKVKG